MEIKKKLKEKRKLKDVNALKGMDTDDLQKEIEKLKESYDKMKNVESDKVDLIMNNTEKLLYKGRLLNNYFKDQREMSNIPHFSLESAADKGATEVIDFKSDISFCKSVTSIPFTAFTSCTFVYFRCTFLDFGILTFF